MENLNSPAPRTALSLSVTFKKNYGRCECLGKIKNISLSGAFIELAGHAFEKDEKLNVNIEVAGRKRKLPAYVVWHNHHGCGVRFVHSSNRDVQIVDDLIYFAESAKSEIRGIADNIFKKVA